MKTLVTFVKENRIGAVARPVSVPKDKSWAAQAILITNVLAGSGLIGGLILGWELGVALR